MSSHSNEQQQSYYDRVRALTDAVTTVNRVEVNQRALIDKILARYASASAVYRELLQNSNDAGATSAEIQFTTTSPTLSSNVVSQVVYRNNGMPFREQDWDRLQKIAEGNPDVSKIGAFGVGAYTMFSITEEPVIVSGDTCLLFCWQGDALFTKTAPNTHVTEWTTFVLPSRDLYPLPDWNDFGEFLTAALTFTGSLKEIVVTVNGVEKLSICKTILQPPRPITTPSQQQQLQQSKSAAAFLWNSMVGSSSSDTNSTCVTKTALFLLKEVQESVVRVTVRVDATCAASMDARYILATAKTRILADMARRMERVTKKQPPPTVTVEIFLNYNEPTAKLIEPASCINSSSSSSSTATLAQQQAAAQIAQSFAPYWARVAFTLAFVPPRPRDFSIVRGSTRCPDGPT